MSIISRVWINIEYSRGSKNNVQQRNQSEYIIRKKPILNLFLCHTFNIRIILTNNQIIVPAAIAITIPIVNNGHADRILDRTLDINMSEVGSDALLAKNDTPCIWIKAANGSPRYVLALMPFSAGNVMSNSL